MELELAIDALGPLFGSLKKGKDGWYCYPSSHQLVFFARGDTPAQAVRALWKRKSWIEESIRYESSNAGKFAKQHALDEHKKHNLKEAYRCGYRFASDATWRWPYDSEGRPLT